MTKDVEKKRDGLAGGVILVAIGLVALSGQFVDLASFPNLGLLVLPGLGALFLLWGIVTREAGPIIPGGILSGIGLGVLLNTGQFEFANGDSEGGVFMLSFALGWVVITALTAVFTRQTHWWPLIPAAIMGLIGGAALLGGLFETVLGLSGAFWPVALIALGVWVLIRAMREKAF